MHRSLATTANTDATRRAAELTNDSAPPVATGPRSTARGPNPEANARLTAATGIVLLVLLAAELATVIMGVPGHLSLHITLGALLVGPTMLKLASTGWRMVRYHRGTPAYVHRGAPIRPYASSVQCLPG